MPTPEPCGGCGQTKRIIAKGLFSRCYERTKPPITCIDCGQQRRPHKKIDAGLCARNVGVCATDQLGLSLAAAARWSKAVGAARSDYAALRATR